MLLWAAGLRKSFGGNVVLKDVSLHLHEGSIVLLRGENASGKTTLLNILTGNLEPDAGVFGVKSVEGWKEFHFPKRWWSYLNPFSHFTPERVAQEGVGRTWQDIRLFPKLTLLDNIAVARPNQFGENPAWSLFRPFKARRHERQNEQEARGLLSDLALAERSHLLSDTLSLGQSKRAAIARAIQAGAKIIFLDEPLAGLDEAGVNSILKMLVSLARKDRITLVIVEHLFHIPRLLKVADAVWTLKDGSLFEESPDEVERELSEGEVDPVRRWIAEAGRSDYELIEQALPGRAMLSILRRLGSHECILKVEGLVVRRRSQVVIGSDAGGALPGLSFELFEGDIAILEAPNGWGKTTLLDAVSGLIPSAQGRIILRGRPINDLPTWRRAQLGVAYLQARGHTFSKLTVAEAFQLAGAGSVPSYLSSLAGRSTEQLSGGQQQLVGLSRLLASPLGRCRLLDEPFNMLDRAAVERAEHMLLPPAGSCTLVAVPASYSHREASVAEAIGSEVLLTGTLKEWLTGPQGDAAG